MLFHISYTSYLENSLDVLSSFVDPSKPLLLEESDDDIVKDDKGLLYDFFSHDDVYINPI
jgi:hypothetical protein